MLSAEAEISYTSFFLIQVKKTVKYEAEFYTISSYMCAVRRTRISRRIILWIISYCVLNMFFSTSYFSDKVSSVACTVQWNNIWMSREYNSVL